MPCMPLHVGLRIYTLHQAEAAERAERDRMAAEERGPAPEPARSFRLPQQLLPDLLVLWELLQTLAPTLQVSESIFAWIMSLCIATPMSIHLGKGCGSAFNAADTSVYLL